MWIQILCRISWAIRQCKTFFQKLSASFTFVAKIVKIDHVVLHNFGSFPAKTFWVRFVAHRCGYKFCAEFYGLWGRIKRFSTNFQLHGLLWPKLQNRQKRPRRPTHFGSFPPKTLWVRFVGHRCGYKFCGESCGLSGHIKRFSRNFQLHGLLWPKSSK